MDNDHAFLDVPVHLRPRRTGVYIKAVTDDGTVHCVLPAWDDTQTVTFALALIVDENLREAVRTGEREWLITKANIDAEHAEQLFFVDFEPSPEPGDVWDRIYQP